MSNTSFSLKQYEIHPRKIIRNATPQVPSEIMKPLNAWSDGNAYEKAALKLANMFQKNFKQFEQGCSEKIIQAGPKYS